MRRRGWCPTVHAPMPSGDGALVRVKPFGGLLTAAALRALAEASRAYTGGTVELTNRGNLQLRAVHDAPSLARALVAAGLADPDPAREMRRNVVAVPPADPALLAAAEAAMAGTPGLAAKRMVAVQGSTLFLDGAPVASLCALRAALARPATPARWAPPPPAGKHLLHLPFGQTDAATLARLAILVPWLRTTPWRAFLSPLPVPGFAHPAANAACAGAPACANATTPTRADALRLQALGLAGIHVSGCAKGCAHPADAPTLVAHAGRYDLVPHGRAGDAPAATGLTLPEAAAFLARPIPR